MDIKVKKSDDLQELLKNHTIVIDSLDISNEAKEKIKNITNKVIDIAMEDAFLDAFLQGCDYMSELYNLANSPIQFPLQ